MGILPDESPLNPKKCGPYIQSQKLERYSKLALKLVEEGKAYYCFCTPEQLEADRQLALKNHQTPKYNRRCLNLSKKEIRSKSNSAINSLIDNTSLFDFELHPSKARKLFNAMLGTPILR